MPTYDNALTSTITFGEVLTPTKDARPLADTLTFTELFCVQIDSGQSVSDTLTFNEALIGTNNFVSEASTPPGGLDDPPHSISSSLALRRRLADPLIFEEKLDVVGGLIIDTGCTPNTFTPNFPTFCWYRLSEDEWADLDEDQYAWLDEICGDPPTLDETVLGYNPALYYNFENVVGTTVPDLAAVPHDGTLYSAAIVPFAQDPPSTHGLETYVGASGVIVPLSFVLPNPSPGITICFWLYYPTYSTGYGGSTFAFPYNPDITNRTLAHAPWADGIIYWDHGSAFNLTGRVSGSFAGNYDKWVFVILRSTGSSNRKMEIRIDNTVIASYAGSENPLPHSGGGGVGFFDVANAGGRIQWMDNFAVFNEYLSDEKVQALVNAGRGHW